VEDESGRAETAEEFLERTARDPTAALNEKTTLTVRNMDRMVIGQIKMIGDARGWTIADTLDQMIFAITKFQMIADDQPNSEVAVVMDSFGLTFVQR
jgi:hypothetical protein